MQQLSYDECKLSDWEMEISLCIIQIERAALLDAKQRARLELYISALQLVSENPIAALRIGSEGGVTSIVAHIKAAKTSYCSCCSRR